MAGVVGGICRPGGGRRRRGGGHRRRGGTGQTGARSPDLRSPAGRNSGVEARRATAEGGVAGLGEEEPGRRREEMGPGGPLRAERAGGGSGAAKWGSGHVAARDWWWRIGRTCPVRPGHCPAARMERG